MDNLYIKIPSEEDELLYYDYIADFKNNSDDNNIFCIPAQIKYKRWLKMVKMLYKKSPKDDNRIITYFFMTDTKIIGHISIKPILDCSNEDLLSGNIDGAIRPSMRGLGYGRIMLSLAIKKCIDYDLSEVYVNCSINNISSNKNIKDNGGELQGIIYNPNDNTKYKQYKIKIKR